MNRRQIEEVAMFLLIYPNNLATGMGKILWSVHTCRL